MRRRRVRRIRHDGRGSDLAGGRGELEDFGEGRIGSLNRVVYTWRKSGEVADVKTARLVYTVRDGKIVRYELEDLEDSAGTDRTAD